MSELRRKPQFKTWVRTVSKYRFNLRLVACFEFYDRSGNEGGEHGVSGLQELPVQDIVIGASSNWRISSFTVTAVRVVVAVGCHSFERDNHEHMTLASSVLAGLGQGPITNRIAATLTDRHLDPGNLSVSHIHPHSCLSHFQKTEFMSPVLRRKSSLR